MRDGLQLHVEVPGDGYHQRLISCQVACPVHTDARGYVRAIADGRFEDAYLIARGPNPLASICGRVCGRTVRGGLPPRKSAPRGRRRQVRRPRPAHRHSCVEALRLRPFGPEPARGEDVLRRVRNYRSQRLGRCRGDGRAASGTVWRGTSSPPQGQRVAIIGSGPAGLSAAHDLALMGFRPVIFESEPVPAGMLAAGRARVSLAARVDRPRGGGDRGAGRGDSHAA